MNVLIGCEESGVLRRAFRGRDHNAYSCDLEESADNSDYHLGYDIFRAIESADYLCGHGEEWDLIILHPPCDYLALSGNRWYGKDTELHHMRVEAIEWTKKLWAYATGRARCVAMENPASVIFPRLNTHTQFIQPHMFGHPEFKKTGFALRNLPELVATNQLVTPLPGTPEYKEWQKVWRMGPSADRKKMRSRTYLGVADAIAHQWGDHITK